MTVTLRDLLPVNCLLSSIAWFAGGDGVIVPSSCILYRDKDEACDARGHIAQHKEVVELYDRLRPSLYQYLICLGLKPQDSDDVIQETFLRLFRFQACGGTVEKPRSWVFRVAHNLSLDVRKVGQRLISECNEEVTSAAIGRPDSSLNPEEIFLQKEQLLRLDAAMS